MTSSWFRNVNCESDECLYCLACTAIDLPAYTNAHLQESQSTGIDQYNPGDQVTYECNDGFVLDPSIPILACFCSDNLHGIGLWRCSHQGTTTVCIPSKQIVVLFQC